MLASSPVKAIFAMGSSEQMEKILSYIDIGTQEMLDHYQQVKNLLVSYSPKALGWFF